MEQNNDYIVPVGINIYSLLTSVHNTRTGLGRGCRTSVVVVVEVVIVVELEGVEVDVVPCGMTYCPSVASVEDNTQHDWKYVVIGDQLASSFS